MVLVYMLTIGGILMGSMLPYTAAPWIRHGIGISMGIPFPNWSLNFDESIDMDILLISRG
jgi:hypothetical protein